MASCKFCRAPISWKIIGGKWVPHEPDGSGRHTCLVSAPTVEARVPLASKTSVVTDVPVEAYRISEKERDLISRTVDALNSVNSLFLSKVSRFLEDLHATAEEPSEYDRVVEEYKEFLGAYRNSPAFESSRPSAPAGSAVSDEDDIPPPPPDKKPRAPRKPRATPPMVPDIPPPPPEGMERYEMPKEELDKIMARKEDVLKKVVSVPFPPSSISDSSLDDEPLKGA